MKNKHAQNLSKLRWEGKTKEQRSAHGKAMVDAREARREVLRNMPVIEEKGFVEPLNMPPTYPQF
jgi:hypothetical protein